MVLSDAGDTRKFLGVLGSSTVISTAVFILNVYFEKGGAIYLLSSSVQWWVGSWKGSFVATTKLDSKFDPEGVRERASFTTHNLSVYRL